MSISASYMRILLDGGFDIAECILVAEAMERGDDRTQVYSVIEPMIEAGLSAENIARAMIEIADAVRERRSQPCWLRFGPFRPDPYKQRRGLSKGQWRRLREAIFERDGRKCSYCGATEDLAVDHVVPLSRGGTNDPGNLTPACKPCNSSKRDKLVEEWLGY